MTHNLDMLQRERRRFRKQGPTEANVSLLTEQYITSRFGRESLTLGAESGDWVRGLPQKVVESAPRTLQPFDLDVDRPPLPLVLILQERRNTPGQVECAAITEVKARPSHGGSLAEGTKP